MTGPEIVKFSAAVSSAYTPNELVRLLLTLNRNFLDYVIVQAPFPNQVIQLVGTANSQGWISQLVLAIVNDRPNVQSIKNFLVVHPYWDPTKYPPLTHPADTLRVYGGRSFIGRNVLRSALKKMNNPTGRKVLVVISSHRRVGKTYSTELINFVSGNLQPSKVAYIDLDSQKYDPIKLAKKLATNMHLSPDLIPDESTEQATRSNQELVSLLTTNTANPPPVIWIVFDGFRDQVPAEAIQDFIAQLAQKIQSMQEFRLILLNYPVSLPLAVGGFIIKDELQPLTRAELETHFTNVHRQKYNANPSPQELAEYLLCMDEAFKKRSQDYPESVNDHVLVNLAVSDVVDTIEEDVP